MTDDSDTNIKFSQDDGIAPLSLARHDIRNTPSEKDFTEDYIEAVSSIPDKRSPTIVGR